MNIRSKLSSKKLFGGFIIVFTIVTTGATIIIEPRNIERVFELIGSNFVYGLVIGGIPFVIYHFIIGDKKKKRAEWKCEHCKFKTGTKENLKEHYESQHSDKKNDSFHRKHVDKE